MSGFSILKLQKYVYLPAALLLMAYCNLINPDEPVPVVVACDTIGFHVTNASQGTNSSSITDMWLFVDGNLLGAFELPAHIPVLAEGSHTLTIRPGILINGIKGSRGPYPFYTSYDT